jgi:hypothetical protein
MHTEMTVQYTGLNSGKGYIYLIAHWNYVKLHKKDTFLQYFQHWVFQQLWHQTSIQATVRQIRYCLLNDE